MTVIQKFSNPELQQEKKKKEPWEKKKSHERKKRDQKKFTFFRNSYFHFEQNHEQNIQNFKLFGSKCLLEKFMRSIRSHIANHANQHIAHSSKRIWFWQKKLFKTNFAHILWNELPMWIPKWGLRCPIVRRFGDFADSCYSLEQFGLIKN